MAGNTTRRHQGGERRSSRRVPVLFSALLTRTGWRTQIVEVLDLSEDGAKVQLRFPFVLGAGAILKLQGPTRKLEVPCAVVNSCEEHGHPVAGLRFEVSKDIRAELAEIVERVGRSRVEAARPPLKAAATRRTRKARAARDSAAGGV